MKRILVFNGRDWLHPKAGWVEHYLHEVCARLTMQGHYVVWVAHHHGLVRSRTTPIEIVDRIQIARLGSPLLYRIMSGLFLRRLHFSGSRMEPFDAVLECLVQRPLGLHQSTETPVIPVVFNLNPRVRASDDPPGPVIVPTRLARDRVLESGLPENFVVYAPFGVDTSFYTVPKTREDVPLVAAVYRKTPSRRDPRMDACRRLRAAGTPIDVEIVSPSRPHRLPEYAKWTPDEGHETRKTLFRRAWFGYCGVGAENEALAMAASGLALFCPDTERGREYVEHESTGLLYVPGKPASVGEGLTQLIKDEVLRKRMSNRARAVAEKSSWELTAGLVLATVENLPKPQPDAVQEQKWQ